MKDASRLREQASGLLAGSVGVLGSLHTDLTCSAVACHVCCRQVLADYPAGTFLKLGNTNAAVLPKVPKTQRMPGERTSHLCGWRASAAVWPAVR